MTILDVADPWCFSFCMLGVIIYAWSNHQVLVM
jgi:hypothetical protein